MATVVQAHPLDDSYNAALRARVVAGLEAGGDPSVVFGIGDGERPHSEDLRGTQHLVLVYPTWWGGPPAMLLDWIQEMLAAGAFATVTRIDVVTTHGSSRLVNFVQGTWGRRFIEHQVAGSCAPGATVGWHALYKIDRCSDDELGTFLRDTQVRFTASPTA